MRSSRRGQPAKGRPALAPRPRSRQIYDHSNADVAGAWVDEIGCDFTDRPAHPTCVASGGLISHDEAVSACFVEHRTDALISAARVVSAIGSFVSVSILGVLLGIWLWRGGWQVALAVAPAVSLVLASLASTAAKALFDRERPPVVLHATTVSLAAFPSGHATDAAAFFLAASLTLAITIADHRSTPALLVTAGLSLALLVGLSRLVLGVHWFSDVVAGWALGSAIAVAGVVTLWYLSTRRQDDQSALVP